MLFLIAEGYYRLRHEEGLGMGDVKMLAMIGAFLGWQLTLLSLMIASFAGTIIGVALIATGRGTMKYALPFGTFLAIGAAVSAAVGPADSRLVFQASGEATQAPAAVLPILPVPLLILVDLVASAVRLLHASSARSANARGPRTAALDCDHFAAATRRRSNAASSFGPTMWS